MPRIFVAVLAVAVLVLGGPVAVANYMIIRIVLDGGTANPANSPMPLAPGFEPTPMPADGGAGFPGPAGLPELPGGIPMGPEGLMQPPAVGDPARSIVVVVPVFGKLDERKPFNERAGVHPKYNPYWNAIVHKFGTTYLFTDGTTVNLHPLTNVTLEKAIRDRYVDWEAKKKGLPVLHELAVDALATGMTAETITYCDKLLAAAKAQKGALTPEVKRFVDAYSVLGPKLKAPSPQPADADLWRDQLATLSATGAQANVQKYNHYALVYWDAANEDVMRRLKMLEENFQNFYLWHALRGETPTVPSRPLVALLAPQTKDMPGLYRALDGRSLTTDAFYSPEYGVLVMSPGRIDELGQAYQRMMIPVYRGGASQADLVRGKGPPIKDNMPAESVARMMTLAMVDRYLQEDSEAAAISREGSRQILAAIGAVPQHVALPRWLENGYGSLFERPIGPVFTGKGTDNLGMTLAMRRGTGSANFVMYKHYRDLIESKELNPSPEALLQNVISNAYFSAIKAGEDIDPKPTIKGPAPPPPNPMEDPAVKKALKQEKLTNKANATAWALTYYLAQTKSQQLYEFGRELDKLPRDLPIDDSALLLAFGKAFGLLATDGQSLDPAALKTFARAWVEYMYTIRQQTIDIPIPKPAPMPPMPLNPMQPGGMPPGGGSPPGAGP